MCGLIPDSWDFSPDPGGLARPGSGASVRPGQSLRLAPASSSTQFIPLSRTSMLRPRTSMIPTVSQVFEAVASLVIVARQGPGRVRRRPPPPGSDMTERLLLPGQQQRYAHVVSECLPAVLLPGARQIADTRQPRLARNRSRSWCLPDGSCGELVGAGRRSRRARISTAQIIGGHSGQPAASGRSQAVTAEAAEPVYRCAARQQYHATMLRYGWYGSPSASSTLGVGSGICHAAA